MSSWTSMMCFVEVICWVSETCFVVSVRREAPSDDGGKQGMAPASMSHAHNTSNMPVNLHVNTHKPNPPTSL